MTKKVKEDDADGTERIAPKRADPALSAEQLAELRVQRIAEYSLASLRSPDPLRAALGAANAALMQIDLQVERAVLEYLEESPQVAERLAQANPAIELHLRLLRQVDRLAQFEQRAVAGELAHRLQATRNGDSGEETET